MELSQIVSTYPHIVFKKGDYLLSQQETVDYLYYVISGTVIGSMIDVNGNEYMSDTIPPSQGINSIAALGMGLLDKNEAKFNLVALSKTVCCKIPNYIIQEYLLQHPEQLLQFTKKLGTLYHLPALEYSQRFTYHTRLL